MFYLTLPFKLFFNKYHYNIFYKEAQKLILNHNIIELRRFHNLLKDYNNSIYSNVSDKEKIQDRHDILRLTIDISHYLYG